MNIAQGCRAGHIAEKADIVLFPVITVQPGNLKVLPVITAGKWFCLCADGAETNVAGLEQYAAAVIHFGSRVPNTRRVIVRHNVDVVDLFIVNARQVVHQR